MLAQLGLADKYKGLSEANGEDYNVSYSDEGPRPFKAVLDVGLARTTTGARIFAVMKGALDGGLDVPHKETRFAGFKKDAKKLDTATFRKYLFGGHVADYMNFLQKNNAERYQKQFSQYIKAGIKAGDIEASYKKVHAAIRANPAKEKRVAKTYTPAQKKKFQGKTPLSLAQRKDRVRQRLASKSKLVAKVQAMQAAQ